MDKFDKHRGRDRYNSGAEDLRHFESAGRHLRGVVDAPAYPYHQENYRGVRGGRASSTYHGGPSDSGGGGGGGGDVREDRRPFDSPPRYSVQRGVGDGGFRGVGPIGDGILGFRPIIDTGAGRGGFPPMGDSGRAFRPPSGVGRQFGSMRGGAGERLQSMGGGRGDVERFRPMDDAGVEEERLSMGGNDKFQNLGGGERFSPMGGSKTFKPTDGGAGDRTLYPPMGWGGENFLPIGGGGETLNTMDGEGCERSKLSGAGVRERTLRIDAGGIDGGDAERFRPRVGGHSSGDGEIFRSVSRNDDRGFILDKNRLPVPPITGQKRGYSFYGRERSPDRSVGGSFVKLFVGSIPRTATEVDIRPLFDKHGHVMEFALIRDKRTGQQQGCCFIKYASSEEADRAVRALHNQYTLPGGVGPIQVRYADGERERLGATEHKLFVGSLNRQATEKEVEEIFLPYGRVEDVYLMRDEMRQSRGCGFVKFSQREMAKAAINALNGTYTMRGCDQPLNVRFADPKRPRPGESRGGPHFADTDLNPHFSVPGIRPAPDFLGEPLHTQIPSNSWPPASSIASHATVGNHDLVNQLPTRTGEMDASTPGPIGALPRNFDGSLPARIVSSAPITQKQFKSPQRFSSSLQLKPPNIASSTNTHDLQGSNMHFGSTQMPPAGQPLVGQAPPSRQSPGFNGHFPYTQPQVRHHASLSPGQATGSANQQLPSQLLHPRSQSPSQLAQMLSQQKQTLQATFQSSQQAFNELQQQVQQLQPSTPNLTAQQGRPASKQQSSWAGIPSQPVSSTPITHPSGDVAPSTSVSFSIPALSPTLVPPVSLAPATVNCNWTEHTSPDGYKYYYNGLTGESKWEKPAELLQYEQQQQHQHQHQKPYSQHSQGQPRLQSLSTQQTPQMQGQPHGQHPGRIQNQIQQSRHSYQSSPYQGSLPSTKQIYKDVGYSHVSGADSVNNPALYRQQNQASQEWIWKNKPSGT